MIAFGIVLFILGIFIQRVWGLPYAYAHNQADYVAGTSALIGIVLIVAGVVKLAWEFLP